VWRIWYFYFLISLNSLLQFHCLIDI
jgi:hypothetical protein